MKIISTSFFLLLFLISVLTYSNSFAGNPVLMDSVQALGKISGTVVDKDNNIPLSAVSVQLFNSENSLITGAETGTDGKFQFDNLSNGTYNIKIELVGYSTANVKGVTITKDKPSVSIETVKLKSGSVTTEEIVVEAEKSAIELKPDKKVFNVEGNMITEGGSAVDVLKNVASVSVDVDGNISLRGSQDVKVIVDGKPFGQQGANLATLLEQIPANQISSIELITNPSAKYEAEGTSGIINIVLKKGTGFGYNGSVSVNAGTKDKYNGTLNMNLRNNKVKLYGSYDYRLYNFVIQGTSGRNNFINPTSSFILQENAGRSRNITHFSKAGFDYTLSERSSFSLSGSYTDRDRKRNENTHTTQNDLNNVVNTEYDLFTTDATTGYNFDMALNYTQKFKNPKQLLTGDFSFFKYKDNSVIYSSREYAIPVTIDPPKQEQFNIDDNNESNAQIDYTHPFSENSKFEIGYKGIFKKSDKDYKTDIFNYTTNSFLPDINQSNQFIYKEQIHSGYTQLAGKIKEFGYQLGLRAEQTNVDGDLKTTNKTFTNSYFDLFPSASLSQKLGLTEEIQVSYSRRISRPALQQLNPFVNTSDPLNYFSGNENLKPEYIDSYELNFLKYFKTVTVNPGIFYRHSKDQLARSRVLIDSNTTLTTFTNYGTTKTYGAELIVNGSPFEFWNLNGSASYFNTDVNAENLQQGFVNDGYTWSGKINSSMRFPGIVDVMMSYFYSGRLVVAQGELSPFQSFDISLKKDFWNNQASVALRVSDVFNNLKFQVLLDGSRFSETFFRKRDTRSAFLTFTYKFGQADKDEKRQRRNSPDQNNNDGMGF